MHSLSVAQRRPGREPRRHARRLRHPLDAGLRSTKAGARTPATPRCAAPPAAPPPALNEGRGANPGDTCPGCVCRWTRGPLNEGRGANPGDTTRRCRPAAVWRSLNEGRGANPGDTRPERDTSLRPSALNEGRGANPGDTAVASAAAALLTLRSTKAGARTPATHDADRLAAVAEDAQRRPGREPRRHAPRSPPCRAISCAQRRPGREPRRHPDPPRAGGWRPAALNEGRGANPGDTGPLVPRLAGLLGRSTKAGARTPATPPGRQPERRVHRARSTKAGARTPATRDVDADAAGAAGRSTKAGARTPATLLLLRSYSHPASAQRRPGREPRRHTPAPRQAPRSGQALNEGRGANPGDTARRAASASPRRPLNEGRGANPGDTVGRGIAKLPISHAQRRPGREPRRHERQFLLGLRQRQARSTKAGARTPATHDKRRVRFWRVSAQRRPGREPRRHPRRRARRGAAAPSLNEGRGANPGDTRGSRRPH